MLWKLRRPSILTSTSTEDVLAQAKQAISALKTVPGPEVVRPQLKSSRALLGHSIPGEKYSVDEAADAPRSAYD